MVGKIVDQLKPTTDEAISYIISVKETLHDEPEKYDEFFKLLLDVTSNRYDLFSPC